MTVVDLSSQALPTGPLPSLASDQVINVKRETTRRMIAYILLVYLGVIVVAGLVILFSEGIPLQRAKDIIGLLLGPMIGLVGTVVGFYFGAQTARDASNG